MHSETDKWPDLAGRIIDDETGRRHVLPVRVYFEDTDFSSLAYHGSYVRWCERGRSDFLRLLGTDARRLIDGSDSHEPAAFVVRRMHCDFLRPARMDDVLEVETRVKELGGASVTLLQIITRLDDGVRPLAGSSKADPEGEMARGLTPQPRRVRLFEAEVTVVLVSVSGKPMRLSTAVRSAFRPPS